MALYKLRVRPARSSEFLDLKEDFGDVDFYEYFSKVLTRYKAEIYGQEEDERHLKVQSYEDDCHVDFNDVSYKKVHGVIQSGDSGYVSEIYNTRNASSRKKEKHEAELLPHYICLTETANSQECLLCLQRYGNSGVLTILIKLLRSEMKSDFPGLILEQMAFLPDFYINELLNSSFVSKFAYTYLSPVSDQATLLTTEGGREGLEGRVVVKTTIKSVKGQKLSYAGSSIKGITSMLQGMGPKSGIEKEDILDKTVEFVNDKGKKRSFSLKRGENEALPYIDVTDEVALNDEGHPEYGQLKDVVSDIFVKADVY